jgi:hypothetical protein
MGRRKSGLAVVLLACATAAADRAAAQEIEPRAFSPSPTGVTFVVAAAGRSTGGILTDPSLPVDDVDATVDAVAVAVGHTFEFLGRSASIAIAQPRLAGRFTGTLNGEDAEASRSGLGDTKLRLATNFFGGPALTPAEFATRTPTTTLGASLIISAPTGDYHGDKLINIGTNRWAVKPEIGITHPVGKWYLEATAGVWVFEDNDEFFGGQRREQDPLASVQAHVSYTFRPRLWLAVNAIYYDGGRTTIDGVLRDDRQSNSRYGLTLSVPVGAAQSLKFTWSDGASTRIGSDFTSYGIAWQYTHIGR